MEITIKNSSESQNIAFTQQQHFDPNANSNNQETLHGTTTSLNANAVEFVPMTAAPPQIWTQWRQNYNPYLTAENAHTADPHALSSDFVRTKQSLDDDEYEVWEDENGEIIVVEKDQLYADDPYYQDQKLLKRYNQEKDEKKSGSFEVDPRNNHTSNHSHSNPDYDPNATICRFWLNGNCAYERNCKMAHRFETNSCPHCEEHIGKSPLLQQQHLQECQNKIVLDEEVKMSQDVECAICRENVLEKGSKFGLLTGCTHGFCLDCIREWRSKGVLHQSKKVVRSCPICRQITWFIVPCDRFVTDAKRKAEIIEKYKKRLSEIRCKHFDREQECPFGSSCFYKHVRKDGSVEDKKKERHRDRMSADKRRRVIVMKQLISLLASAHFLFGISDNESDDESDY